MNTKSQKKNLKKPSLFFTMVKAAPKREGISRASSQLGTKTRIPESVGVKLETSKYSSAQNIKNFRFI